MELKAISPIDGRYNKITKELSDYFSELALIKYRLNVEINYFLYLIKFLGKDKNIDKNLEEVLNLYMNINIEDAQSIKKIERKTNHDVKAIEYYLRSKFDNLGLGIYKEYIHFGLTSQDVNSVATSLSLSQFLHKRYIPDLDKIINNFKSFSKKWEKVNMLSRTHGQPATATKVGREFKIYLERLDKDVKDFKFTTKFGGCVGNLNAHYTTYPEYNWEKFCDDFIKEVYQMKREKYTTQIHNYIQFSKFFDMLKRINIVLIDFCIDMWSYISLDYFTQEVSTHNVGSSTMPHKNNPIHFENAEGNLLMCNNMLTFFSEKLPISRLQRDLTDSTILRNLGQVFGWLCVGLDSLDKGLRKLVIKENKIREDLENHPEILLESYQTILRKYNYQNGYEEFRKLASQNDKLTIQILHQHIDEMYISDEIKKELKEIKYL